VVAYADGLSIVERRFWTTAFMDSAYWDAGRPAVLEANTLMLNRIRENNGTARRLLIRSQAPADAAKSLSSYVRYPQGSGRTDEAEERERQVSYFRTAMSALDQSGFETRVGTDYDSTYLRLPIRINGAAFSPYKFGLTLYDDVRIDVFREGKFGLSGSV